MLISADRHRSDLWKIDRPAGYPLYEFNSSRLTNQHVHGEMKAALFSYNKKQSFGTVDFDTTLADINEMYIAQAKQVLDDIANGRKAVTPFSKNGRWCFTMLWVTL